VVPGDAVAASAGPDGRTRLPPVAARGAGNPPGPLHRV